MHIDPMKLVTMAAAPVLNAVREQFRLRDADSKPVHLSGVDSEIDQALDLLARNSPTAPKALVDFLKGSIAGRPDIFNEEPVAQWLATDRAREALRAAVHAYMDEKPVQPFADEAAEFFAAFEGADGPGRGYAAFEYALAYALLAIANKLDTGDRVILETVRRESDRVHGAITGGNTWGYVMLYHFDMGAAVAQNYTYIRKGEHPLYDVRVRIRDMNSNRDILEHSWGEISAPAEFQLVRFSLAEHVYLRVFHHARNGQWHQDLILERSDDASCWLCATRVSDFQGNPMWSHLDHGFADCFGEPEWRA